MSSLVFSPPFLAANARTRPITSAARLPSLMIHSTERRAASTSGLLLLSQRKQASALAMMAASG